MNGTGVRHLARLRGQRRSTFFRETPGRRTRRRTDQSVNAYGRGKLAGERVAVEPLLRTDYIVRTAWLYSTHGRNFLTTMLQLVTQRETLGAVADQHGQPTWSRALAGQLAALGGRAPAGVHHSTAVGRTAWYGLARDAFRLSGLDRERIRSVGFVTLPRPAARPALGYSGTRSRQPAAYRARAPPAVGGPADRSTGHARPRLSGHCRLSGSRCVFAWWIRWGYRQRGTWWKSPGVEEATHQILVVQNRAGGVVPADLLVDRRSSWSSSTKVSPRAISQALRLAAPTPWTSSAISTRGQAHGAAQAATGHRC
ncbi:SDR family oxidoreductase [Streptomyces sp. NPDC005071]